VNKLEKEIEKLQEEVELAKLRHKESVNTVWKALKSLDLTVEEARNVIRDLHDKFEYVVNKLKI